MIDLPKRAAYLYNLLEGKGDVDIKLLCRLYFGYTPSATTAAVRPQCRLGPPISRLNRKIRRYGQVIEPGRVKGTYRLIST